MNQDFVYQLMAGCVGINVIYFMPSQYQNHAQQQMKLTTRVISYPVTTRASHLLSRAMFVYHCLLTRPMARHRFGWTCSLHDAKIATSRSKVAWCLWYRTVLFFIYIFFIVLGDIALTSHPPLPPPPPPPAFPSHPSHLSYFHLLFPLKCFHHSSVSVSHYKSRKSYNGSYHSLERKKEKERKIEGKRKRERECVCVCLCEREWGRRESTRRREGEKGRAR